MPKLVVFRGDAVESEFRLAGRNVTIGRDKGNDIVLDDSQKGVSRFHAEVRADAGTYFIVDAKSRNGVWINGRRIDEKAELALGVPVTVGAYELVLEDDVSSGEFVEPPAPKQRTIVGGPAPVEPARPTRSTTPGWSIRSLVAAPDRQVLLWSAVAVAVLLIAGVIYALRGKEPAATVAVDLPQSPPLPTLVGVRQIEVPSKEAAISAHLAAARTSISDHDSAGALRDHIRPVLWIEPENQEALDLKRQAEGAGKLTTAKPAPTPPEPVLVETAGVPRRLNEGVADYNARVSRLAANLREANRFLEAQDFVNALIRFRAIENDQKGYQNVDALISDTLNKQRVAVEIAINNGQQNEQQKLFHAARAWYQKAMAIDPGSTAAHDRHDSLLTKMNQEAHTIFNLASTNKKLQNKDTARKQFQQIVDMMLPGDEMTVEALKELEALKR